MFASPAVVDGPPNNSSAPVFVIRDVAREVGAGQNDQQVMNSLGAGNSLDIIDTGFLGSQDASSLLALFVHFEPIVSRLTVPGS
jgi:hypothetical protein